MMTDIREALHRAADVPVDNEAVIDAVLVRYRRSRRHTTFLVSVGIIVLVVGFLAGLHLASDRESRSGQIGTAPRELVADGTCFTDPGRWVGPNGAVFAPLNPTTVGGTVAIVNPPDFVPVACPDSGIGIAGYVRYRDISGAASASPVSPPVPVVGADGSTVVGHMYSGRGFVRLGQDPQAVPDRSIVSQFSAENSGRCTADSGTSVSCEQAHEREEFGTLHLEGDAIPEEVNIHAQKGCETFFESYAGMTLADAAGRYAVEARVTDSDAAHNTAVASCSIVAAPGTPQRLSSSARRAP